MLNVYHRPNQAAATIFIPHRTFFFWYASAAYQASVSVEPWFVFTHGETKRALYAVEASQKGTIRYLPHANSAK